MINIVNMKLKSTKNKNVYKFPKISGVTLETRKELGQLTFFDKVWLFLKGI